MPQNRSIALPFVTLCGTPNSDYKILSKKEIRKYNIVKIEKVSTNFCGNSDLRTLIYKFNQEELKQI